MTPVAIGDIQRTQGTLKTVYMPKNRLRHLYCVYMEVLPSADLGKSRWGFAIKHSSSMGVKGYLSHSGMYAGLLLQIWENLVGVWQSCILINLR